MGRFAPDARRLLTILLAGALAGCPADDPTGPGDDSPPRYTTPAAVVAAHAGALNERDLADYIALLEPYTAGRADAGFRWYPQTQDLTDFPWLDLNTWWAIDEEIDMITNMFDPAFMTPQTGQAVQSITADLDIYDIEVVSDEETRAHCYAIVTVLWDEDSGLRADVRLEFLLARRDDGTLIIRSITEHPLIGGRGVTNSVEATTLSSIKNLYRSPVTP